MFLVHVAWSFQLVDDIRRLLTELSRPAAREPEQQKSLLTLASPHGLAGALLHAWLGAAFPVVAIREHELREMAREVDHAAHLGWLGEIDRALVGAKLDAVVLKGPLFAERFYPRPSTRATSDVDLLVAYEDLDRASAVLRSIGYLPHQGAIEERFRREHHHLHFSHPESLPLELHFHGFTAFGATLRSAPLIARRRPAPIASFRALGILEPEDELVFLAAHVAAHRFLRAAWLYDLVLILDTMVVGQIQVAAERARATGFGHAFAVTGAMLARVSDVAPEKLAAFGRLSPTRRNVIALVGEPVRDTVRSATRFAYTTALCDSFGAVSRYGWRAARDHALRLVGFEA